MPVCAVVNCKSRSSSLQGKFKYHAFPHSEEMRLKWVTACRREKEFKFKGAAVCNRHFTDDCYEYVSTRRKALVKRLKKESVPIVHLDLQKTRNKVMLNYWSECEKAGSAHNVLGIPSYNDLIEDNEETPSNVSLQPFAAIDDTSSQHVDTGILRTELSEPMDFAEERREIGSNETFNDKLLRLKSEIGYDNENERVMEINEPLIYCFLLMELVTMHNSMCRWHI
ncbi:PREDICTED: THAP domain-containing protein 2-like, partial [Cyphomyrmex costatus]|uniref:THAP domain-containing protein 2-like n=1 Tax=Cyphomyrmex costatus TaxID=456900 RepID=UPI00085242D9